MATQTRKAIQKSFLKLAAKKPVDKITVKDIVEDCEINRNSFYYHFEDLPNLIEETLEEVLMEAIRKENATTMLDVFHVVCNIFNEYGDLLRNLFYSRNRSIVEYRLVTLSEQMVRSYLEYSDPDWKNIIEEDQDIIIRYYCAVIIGLIMEWMNKGMHYNLEDQFIRMYELRMGTKSMTEKARKKNPEQLPEGE